MAGLSELSGSLIQMNEHMVMTKIAEAITIIGILAAVIFIVAIVSYLNDVKKWKKMIAICSVLAILCGAIVYWGYTMPREKIIMACVNGPISIERISGVYDILEIDGKMLKLRER